MILKAVFFDMGDTLLHRPPDRAALDRAADDALRAALGARYPAVALPAPADFHKLMQGVLQPATLSVESYAAVLARLVAAQGWPVDPADPDLLAAWHRPLLESGTTEPDLPATLDALRARGLRLGVISNTGWRARYRDQELARAGILDYFPVRIYSADLGIAKPDPRIFVAGLAALGDLRPAEALYVGDNLPGDVGGAQGAGLWAAWLAPPGPRPALSTAAPTPDLLLTALRDLPALLTAHSGLPES